MRPAPFPATLSLALSFSFAVSLSCSHAPGPPASAPRARVIVFVWDGLRPDAITRAETPNLHALREEGVEFADHHSTYPTFTMVNAASLATGSRPGRHGFFGNVLWHPGPEGRDSAGKPVDFNRRP